MPDPGRRGCGCRILSVGGVERHFASTIAIAWNAKVSRVAQIRAEPDAVIANDFGPVIDYLILVLGLQQMAVARVHLRLEPKLDSPSSCSFPFVSSMKKREPGGKGRTRIQSWDARLGGQVLRCHRIFAWRRDSAGIPDGSR